MKLIHSRYERKCSEHEVGPEALSSYTRTALLIPQNGSAKQRAKIHELLAKTIEAGAIATMDLGSGCVDTFTS